MLFYDVTSVIFIHLSVAAAAVGAARHDPGESGGAGGYPRAGGVKCIVYRCSPRHPPRSVSVLATSCTPQCTGARYIIHRIVYRSLPRRPPHRVAHIVCRFSPRHLIHLKSSSIEFHHPRLFCYRLTLNPKPQTPNPLPHRHLLHHRRLICHRLQMPSYDAASTVICGPTIGHAPLSP